MPAEEDGQPGVRAARDIRAARPEDLHLLPEIESAADYLLAEVIGVDALARLPPGAGEDEFAGALKVLVAGRPAIGFARLEEIDGAPHLEQLSVLPSHARSGIGSALIGAAMAWSADAGYPAMTLCTFADVPFNAPFYAACGFTVVPEPVGALADLRRREQQLGLDALGRRVAMRVSLTAAE